ncbi:WbqC family protein [bacterium]|nr:WbqC family protein [bacterium]
MQPYFFPYIGYFSLIHSVDHFMFFDQVQFNKKSWMSRNRLYDPSQQKDYYFRAGIEKPEYKANIQDVKLKSSDDWKQTILAQINSYKNKVSYFDETLSFLKEFFLNDNSQTLPDFNYNSIVAISRYLALNTEFSKYSDQDIEFDELPDASTWSLEVSKVVGASHYINAPGGEEFILPQGFTEANLKLGFIQVDLQEYKQVGPTFIPGLSILDVLLCNGREATAEMVKSYSIKWKN